LKRPAATLKITSIHTTLGNARPVSSSVHFLTEGLVLHVFSIQNAPTKEYYNVTWNTLSVTSLYNVFLNQQNSPSCTGWSSPRCKISKLAPLEAVKKDENHLQRTGTL